MRILYNWAIYLMQLGFRLAALFKPKAKLWHHGRRQWRKKLEQSIQDWDCNEKRVWIHCASLGEFEQGRPLIEKLKAERPGIRIILTFFSPSGYEIRKNYAGADLVFYLPADTLSNANDFIRILVPDLAIFVKYEFWFNYLSVLRKKTIPHFLIAGVFRPKQHFFRAYGGWFRQALQGFTHFFVQDRTAITLLNKIDIQETTLAGDPRIDRVLAIAEEAQKFPLVEAFAQHRSVLVAGSTWPPDEALLLSFIEQALPEDWCVILAPHDISKAHLQQLEKNIKVPYAKYSDGLQKQKRTRILLIDNIGMLSALYQYGQLAYIGGGFGQGIHNTLEPMAFKLPVIVGPKYEKFPEARFLVDHKAGFTVRNQTELEIAFAELQIPTNHQAASAVIKQYLDQHAGATQLIFDFGQEKGFW